MSTSSSSHLGLRVLNAATTQPNTPADPSRATATGASTPKPTPEPAPVAAPDSSALASPIATDLPERAPLTLRLINLGAVLIPFAGLILAIVLLWGVAFDWRMLVIMTVMYLITGFGVTIGYHRYFTHKSFDTPRPIALLLAAAGSMAVEGPLLQWVATHRKHHQHSDNDGDPHSPHANDHAGSATVWGTLRGLWHAHMGWLFHSHTFVSAKDGFSLVPQNLARYIADLERDRAWRFMSRSFPFWVALGLIIPAVAGGVWSGTWTGALLGFLWGGLVRILVLHHVTWSINSVCHLWGTKAFRSHDESRNNAIFGVLALGEGWHNNHHAFPTSARHGLRWWEFDASYAVIRAMELVGLARRVRVPSAERLQDKKV